MTVATFNPKAHQKPIQTVEHQELPVMADSGQIKPGDAPKKVYIVTQGCQMNEYDSKKMGDVLGDSHGMLVTNDINEADVLIMNTCSIREKAQEKVSPNWVAGAN